VNLVRRVAALSILALAALPLAAEDLTIVSKSTHNQDPPQVTTSYISSDKVRMAQADGSELIAEPAAGKFTMIDNRKKEYYVVTKQEMEAASAAMAAKMKELEPQMKKAQEQMKSLPPEIQQKMAGMMGGMAASVTVTKGPGGRTIAGYKCDNWTIAIGQLSKTEQCLTTDVTYPPELWEAYRDFAASWKTSMASMGPMAQSIKDMQEKTKDMKGLPLASMTTVNVMGRTSTDSQEVTEVKKGPVPASAWQIPAGYKQVDSPMARMAKQAK
jgi:hypothetical protein